MSDSKGPSDFVKRAAVFHRLTDGGVLCATGSSFNIGHDTTALEHLTAPGVLGPRRHTDKVTVPGFVRA